MTLVKGCWDIDEVWIRRKAVEVKAHLEANPTVVGNLYCEAWALAEHERIFLAVLGTGLFTRVSFVTLH